jgi:predicted dehydrogenase
MTNKIRWGILSTARIGESAVIPAIHQSNNGEVVAVGSRDLEKGKAFAARNGIPKVHGSYEALIADPDIDAIYNPLPNGLHGLWSIKCAEGGKHVLCEKPLANDEAEARQMAAAFQARGLLLAEAFMYRFHPQMQTAKQMIDSGALGTVHFVNAVFDFSIGDEDDIRLNKDLVGGALMDVGCYCVNVTRFLLGEEPIAASAMADFGARSGVDERMVAILRFPSGAMAHFDCSFRTHFTQTVEVRGSHGRLFVEKAYVPFRPDPDAEVILRYWNSKPGIEKHTYEEIKVAHPNQYTLMVEDFGDAILNQRPLKFPVEDAIAQMRAIDMIYKAAGHA